MPTTRSFRLPLVALVLTAAVASAGVAPPVAAGPSVDAGADHLRWSRHYNQGELIHDYGNAVAASADAIYVAAGASSPGSETFTILRYGLGGALIWAKQVATDRQGQALDIATLPDGGVVVTGYTFGVDDTRLRTMVLEPDGSTRWSRSQRLETRLGLQFPPRVAVGPTGTIHVAGSTGERFLALTYSSAGERGWVRRLDPVPGEPDVATSIAVDARGNAYLTGPVGGGFGGFLTARIRPGGKIAWQQEQQGALSSTLGPSFVGVAPGGRVVVSGVTESTCGVHAATTWSLDAREGTREWLATYPAEPCHALAPAGLGVRPDGSVVVVGSGLAGGSDFDGILVSYGTDGTEEWVTPYGSTGTDVPTGTVVDGGMTYATGMTDVAQETMDVLTVAVDRDGEISWTERYDSGSSSERPTNLALVPDGDVVTTGYDWRPGPLEDVLTLSYRR